LELKKETPREPGGLPMGFGMLRRSRALGPQSPALNCPQEKTETEEPKIQVPATESRYQYYPCRLFKSR